MNIPEKVRKYLKIFIEIGGLATVIGFLIGGQYREAGLSAIIFILLAVIMAKYFP